MLLWPQVKVLSSIYFMRDKVADFPKFGHNYTAVSIMLLYIINIYSSNVLVSSFLWSFDPVNKGPIPSTTLNALSFPSEASILLVKVLANWDFTALRIT